MSKASEEKTLTRFKGSKEFLDSPSSNRREPFRSLLPMPLSSKAEYMNIAADPSVLIISILTIYRQVYAGSHQGPLNTPGAFCQNK